MPRTGSAAELHVVLRNETASPTVPILRIGHALIVHGQRVDIINSPYNDIDIRVPPGGEVHAVSLLLT